jgi:hypothetical protein
MINRIRVKLDPKMGCIQKTEKLTIEAKYCDGSVLLGTVTTDMDHRHYGE